jgi:hypothetical protein
VLCPNCNSEFEQFMKSATCQQSIA